MLECSGGDWAPSECSRQSNKTGHHLSMPECLGDTSVPGGCLLETGHHLNATGNLFCVQGTLGKTFTWIQS